MNDNAKFLNPSMNEESWFIPPLVVGLKLISLSEDDDHHQIIFYYGHLCHRRIGVYMKHTVEIMNMQSD